MKDRIKEFILSIGADVCGVANVDRFSEAPKGFHPRDIFPDCKSGHCVRNRSSKRADKG